MRVFHNFWKCRPCMYRIVIKMSSFSSLIIVRAILKENIVLLLLLYLLKIQPLKKKKMIILNILEVMNYSRSLWGLGGGGRNFTCYHERITTAGDGCIRKFGWEEKKLWMRLG
jgi:hypothetical protein